MGWPVVAVAVAVLLLLLPLAALVSFIMGVTAVGIAEPVLALGTFFRPLHE
jgi:hypothetical protein